MEQRYKLGTIIYNKIIISVNKSLNKYLIRQTTNLISSCPLPMNRHPFLFSISDGSSP